MRLAILVVALGSATAEACPEVGLGEALGAVVEGLSGTHERVSAPVVIPSIGVSRDGRFAGASIGWARGDRQIGGLFPGTETSRVLLHVRHTPSPADATHTAARTTPASAASHPVTSFALTYGWFEHVPSLFDAGLDVGLAGSTAQLGPIVQLTGGLGGLGVRLSGGVELGRDTRITGAAELVLDVLVLVESI